MRLKEFFERLPRTGYVDGADCIRLWVGEMYCCPVTAAMAPKMPVRHFRAAAAIGGMEEWLAGVIAAAADACELDAHDRSNITALRRRLIDHCQPTGAAR